MSDWCCFNKFLSRQAGVAVHQVQILSAGLFRGFKMFQLKIETVSKWVRK